jgi:ABC-type transporter Mla subunit MlaD
VSLEHGEPLEEGARPGECRGFSLLLIVVTLVVLAGLAWFYAYSPSRGAATGDFTVRAVLPGADER